MLREIEGLGQETHWDLYDLQDHWFNQELRVNRRSPRSGKITVAWTQVSPSQIENFVKCKRAWFFKSVARIPEPQKGHQALGTSFHLIMEKVPKGLSFPTREDTNATEEEWDKAKAMANQALPLVPIDPQGLTKREWGISLPTYENGPVMKGYIDLAIPPGLGWPAFLIPSNEAIIGDYKTLSDFRYMKSPEELANSIQMMSYAKWAITDWPSGLVGPTDPLPEHVRLLHIYARTKGPFSRSSIRHESAVVSVPEINLFWDKTLDTIREMQSTASACTSAEDVEATGALTGHCEAYGGCHFRDKCGLAPKEASVKTLFQIGKKPSATPTPPSEQDMSGSPVLQKILAARAAAQGQTQVAPEQGQVSPTPAPAAAISTPTQTVPAVVEAPESTHGNVKPSEAPIQAKGPISGLLAKIQSTGHGLPKLTGSAAQQLNKETGKSLTEYPGEGFRAQTTVASLGELMKLASGIVPPDAPPRTQAVITTPGTPVADPEADPVATTEEGEEDESSTDASTGPVGVAATGVGVSTPTSTTGAADPATTNGTVAPEKKRGRPTKEEQAAKEAAAQAEFNAKVQAEVEKRLAMGSGNIPDLRSETLGELQNTKDALRDAHKDINALKAELERAKSGSNGGGRSQDLAGLTLYVDTIPTKGEAEITDFHEWIRPATQAVEEANSVADWRMINYTSKALLATQLREMIKLIGLPKALMVPSFAAGADIALEILSPLAKRIIRPLK